ncbi:bifunctional phosphoribosyl-AMP cyclohydrolase/phosphoribosyl-ATP diphosphatase HisIE [Lewinella sp. W8]|uniref:bifunctional phosphoribosyl-AMP cyclohydrolase/phosphoribosyl-ATP diphosphatase HisIE n=1 Tax=Lewinella sp. W8 TaxID=2528208 RepID=UPI0010674299|nr:bifunctional phosphoribosyl-AMP cyclohydrolase/phosphoribosyl-ATP diphosphatase HisIE [Lewinella sp. W8]MTB50583.1 bifunctional phosphoribosyl-AMP cyclohydrolase/phosphoribosyl-ATP diphosphatase HisIE [Lewinella sp. W8]
MNELSPEQLAFDQAANGLLPAIVQDAKTRTVLMQGYMNREALDVTLQKGLVTFFSRSKQRLWTKGESSGNVLQLVSVHPDCDQDSLLILANPAGPTCHTGDDTCWGEDNRGDFLDHLERTIQHRRDNPSEQSYTSKLLARGINKVAQKVGEEAVELVIEAKDDNRDLFLGEAADLMYHYIVLLAAKGYTLEDVREVLRGRHK